MMKLYLVLFLSFAGRYAATATPDSDAREILKATGVKGGLVVHLGCADGKLTAALRLGDSFIVQGLDTSPKKVEDARRHLVDRGVYGAVTVREFDGTSLPYADNMVNLVLIDNPFSVSEAEMMRVLCPQGMLCIKQLGNWNTQTKKWPADLDEWTHYQHDPQGTMVGKDKRVGPPRRIQWVGDPKWLRNHDFMSSMHAMVSARGRIFYIIDEGLRNHVFLPAQWTLVARDAFNGTILWKRPLRDWHPANWPLKSGPGDLPRRLVAIGDRVFVTLGLAERLSELDAATGRVIGTFEGTKSTEEIAFADGTLFLATDPARQPVGYRAETSTYKEINRANGGWGWTTKSPERCIMAVEPDSGKSLWKHAARVAPLTLTVESKRVLFFNGENMVALDRSTGTQEWVSESPSRIKIKPATGAAARVISSDGVVVLCYGTEVSGFAGDSGKLLWEGKIPPTGHHTPSDLFVINGLVWSAHTGAAQQQGTHFIALNLHTGAAEKDFVADNLPGFPMHPRCYPGRATERFIMLPGMGTEFYEVGGTTVDLNDHVRGSCIYGLMPCNGLLYKPPDSCACFYMSKLENLCALAPASPTPLVRPPISDDQRLERGPAFGKCSTLNSPSTDDDWPMYRHDAARSGHSRSAVPAGLKKSWESKLGGKLTQPVSAGGRVYVVSKEIHTVYALDGVTGKHLWQYTAGGRIDSPPTVDQGRVTFGSADGWVNCLRAEDGALAWRYLAAFDDRQIVSYQQPESLWPVSGSVLVQDNAVYGLAGRNMFFDGGLRLVRLDAATGRKLSETVLNELDPQTGKNLQTLIVHKSMPVANADVLSSDGKFIYMATRVFDLVGKRVGAEPVASGAKPGQVESTHLFCPTGFLDDLWFHRSYYIYGETCHEGWAEYPWAQTQYPCGRIVAVDDNRVYGFRADGLGNILLPTPTYRLYAADKKIRTSGAQPGPTRNAARKKQQGASTPDDQSIAGGFKVYWQQLSPPLLVNSMVVSAEKLFVAGPPHVADESKMLGFLPGADDEANRQLKAQDEAWRGKRGALLWVVGGEDGKRLAEYHLEGLPVFDGMIAAGSRLYVSTTDGKLLCLAKSK